ncbi:hypothetical protein J6590_060412 [Homalodisca vitripennis]|nr:hypothetical protein J6590_060412 [Homalodisca vitripennis]
MSAQIRSNHWPAYASQLRYLDQLIRGCTEVEELIKTSGMTWTDGREQGHRLLTMTVGVGGANSKPDALASLGLREKSLPCLIPSVEVETLLSSLSSNLAMSEDLDHIVSFV